MTFPRIVISPYLFEHDLRANAFRVCREGKPVPTFPDQALEIDSSLQARFFQASLKHGKLASELREFTSA